MSPRPGAWLVAERAAWALGLGCLLAWGAVRTDGIAGSRHELERFARLQAARLQENAEPDLSLWDDDRIDAWKLARRQAAPTPLAVVRIPKIHLEVAVLPGTDEFTLNRGIGHISGTALPGKDGNSGIAGHRDGFFRGLKDMTLGDAIEIETLEGKETYRIERMWVVIPEDVSVLEPTPARSVTLVTCFPFYHVGPAPQRFIVRAVRAADIRAAAPAGH